MGRLAAVFLPGEAPSFYLELPRLRWPRALNVLRKTGARVRWYFAEILPLFLLASVLLWAGDLTGLLRRATELLVPVVRLIGLPAAAAPAFLYGFFRRDFGAAGLPYAPAALDLFHSQVKTACGTERADVGPFYCSGDRTVYLDLQFFSAMQRQFGLTGDFAEAYVVAHELGHHIQNLVGVTSRVAAAEQAVPDLANALSVDVELQADCLAGVWAHSAYTRNLLEPGDIEEALHAAQVVGDDFLARASGAQVNPDSWTHGSSAQRTQWSTTGSEAGRPDACKAFSAAGSSSSSSTASTEPAGFRGRAAYSGPASIPDVSGKSSFTILKFAMSVVESVCRYSRASR